MALGEIKNGIGPDAYAIYQQVLAAVVERDHPVGSLYISENPTSPAELYGGTWERIEGKFIMGASDAYPAGSTGGSATHTQTVNEIARHNVMFPNTNSGSGITVPAGGIRLSIAGNIFTFPQEKEENANGYHLPAVGSSQPMNILNPYYSMYIWRRVA